MALATISMAPADVPAQHSLCAQIDVPNDTHYSTTHKLPDTPFLYRLSLFVSAWVSGRQGIECIQFRCI